MADWKLLPETDTRENSFCAREQVQDLQQGGGKTETTKWLDLGKILCYSCYLLPLRTKLIGEISQFYKQFEYGPHHMLRIKGELLHLTERDCRNKEYFNRENSKYSQQKSRRKAKTECHLVTLTLPLSQIPVHWEGSSTFSCHAPLSELVHKKPKKVSAACENMSTLLPYPMGAKPSWQH